MDEWDQLCVNVHCYWVNTGNVTSTIPCRYLAMTLWKSTSPLTATGRSNMPCMPRMADCGGLMIGVPISEPNTPPLLMVNVPPSMSSTAKSPFFAYRSTQQEKFLVQDVIYTSRAYATMSVSVCLSVTEVHWHIIANLGFKFRSHFTAHCGHCAVCGRIISCHASQC